LGNSLSFQIFRVELSKFLKKKLVTMGHGTIPEQENVQICFGENWTSLVSEKRWISTEPDYHQLFLIRIGSSQLHSIFLIFGVSLRIQWKKKNCFDPT